MWKSLSPDARNSLVAVAAVSAMAGAFWGGLVLLRDVEVPRWAWAVLGAGVLLNLFPVVSSWRNSARRERSEPEST